MQITGIMVISYAQWVGSRKNMVIKRAYIDIICTSLPQKYDNLPSPSIWGNSYGNVARFIIKKFLNGSQIITFNTYFG